MVGKWIKRTSENCEGIGKGWIREYGELGELGGAKGNGNWQRIGGYTDKKENNIFLIYREIQKGSGAKSYLRRAS